MRRGETLHPPSSDRNWWQNGQKHSSLRTRPAAPPETCGRPSLCHSCDARGGEGLPPLPWMLPLRSARGFAAYPGRAGGFSSAGGALNEKPECGISLHLPCFRTSCHLQREENRLVGRNREVCTMILQTKTWPTCRSLACLRRPSPTEDPNTPPFSPLCCGKVDRTTDSSAVFNEDPGPWSSPRSTSHCTWVSSKIQDFHVPRSVVLP